jgi:hypothetical protein
MCNVRLGAYPYHMHIQILVKKQLGEKTGMEKKKIQKRKQQ